MEGARLKKPLSIHDVENILHHLNYRWSLEALALWKGDKLPFSAYRIYEGYESFISRRTLEQIEGVEDAFVKTRLKHGIMDHYLQRALLPHETEMRSWMRGAAAHVNGKKIYFHEIISWCQKSSTYGERLILQKETGPLLKFLKPFALNYWGLLLDILKAEFGYDNYLEYCSSKKGVDYAHFYALLKRFLDETSDLYFPAMERWSRRVFNRPLDALTRFDAIYLLSLAGFDALYPGEEIDRLAARFFQRWGIDLAATPGLFLELGRELGKSSQAMCFILQVPDEVYVLMKPEGGWIDLETLWHELGHGLSAVFTSPDLPLVERDLNTSFSLSEAYAFLLQNAAMSIPFLNEELGLGPRDAKALNAYKVLKDLSIFRRYAAKFLAEYEMFTRGDLSDGRPYAELMRRHTGFYYQPESHLFDLAPEFYSLDYVLGWIAEADMEESLVRRLGDRWMYASETGDSLKAWWSKGSRLSPSRFLEENAIGPFSEQTLSNRWKRALSVL